MTSSTSPNTHSRGGRWLDDRVASVGGQRTRPIDPVDGCLAQAEAGFSGLKVLSDLQPHVSQTNTMAHRPQSHGGDYVIASIPGCRRDESGDTERD